MPLARLFVSASVDRLQDEYLPRIQAALEIIETDDLWWRPKECTNSVGNLLLHLEGNVRQWIISGLGGASDARDRASEFAATDSDLGKPEIFRRLAETVDEACDVIAKMKHDQLVGSVRIQGSETTGLEAVYHVVEHFGWHVGQIVQLAKMKSAVGAQLRFYDDAVINQLRNEPRADG